MFLASLLLKGVVCAERRGFSSLTTVYTKNKLVCPPRITFHLEVFYSNSSLELFCHYFELLPKTDVLLLLQTTVFQNILL